MDNFFIQALARAGSCPQHAKQILAQQKRLSTLTPQHKKRHNINEESIRRHEHTFAKPSGKGPFRIARRFAEKELKALVDYYGIDTNPSPQDDDALDDDQGSLVWNVGDEHEPWPLKTLEDATIVDKIKRMVEAEEPSHEDMFNTYRQLSEPRIVYLTSNVIHRMLHHLSIVERPTLAAMQRYLSILDDMKTAHIHIRSSEWTTATYLAGRYRGAVTPDDLQSALYLWRDMEQRANIKASHVTFNVLFDVAVKAGKFTLAELFLKEMKTRHLKFHRHFRVSLLYYHGVMHNGSGVRRVYQEMVDAGDVVDVVVMNAVIAALIRAGEPSAAQHVFERMKRLAATGRATNRYSPFSSLESRKISRDDRTWRGQRKLGLHLTHEGRRLKGDGNNEGLKVLQDWAPIAPNSRTYSLLIRHEAIANGNLDRVNELLREMGYNAIPVEGSIFVAILHGFRNFGGVRYSSWTRTKLEQTWTEYLQAVHDGLDRTWISKTSVIAALKAFKKCADAQRTIQVWEEAQAVWKPNNEEAEDVLQVLRQLVPREGFFDGMP